jgi:glyoxylate/hydroxypyruvate reductase A
MRLVFYSRTDDPAPWREALTAAVPGLDFRVWPDVGDPATVDCTLVWKPPPGWHCQFPALRAILSLGAGVDALLEDPELPPGVPITRMVDAGMGRQMAEYAAYGVMHFHRRMQEYARLQRERSWQPVEPVMARDFPVGIMGLGVLGRQAADLLVAMGYPTHAWSRSDKSVPGVTAHVGRTALPGFLAAVRILVNFLPLTAETRGLIAAPLLAQLRPGSYLVNLARGGHVVEADVLAALDSGQLGGAMLDVFEQEPLPADNPLWHHPRVVITPHIAAVTLASDAAAQVTENLRRIADGLELKGLVDRQRGY